MKEILESTKATGQEDVETLESLGTDIHSHPYYPLPSSIDLGFALDLAKKRSDYHFLTIISAPDDLLLSYHVRDLIGKEELLGDLEQLEKKAKKTDRKSTLRKGFRLFLDNDVDICTWNFKTGEIHHKIDLPDLLKQI